MIEDSDHEILKRSPEIPRSVAFVDQAQRLHVAPVLAANGVQRFGRIAE